MEQQRPVHRTIVVVDVEGFGDRRRTDRHQLAVREGLYRTVGAAFQQAGLPWDARSREDRGDGLFVLIRPEVPKSLFVESLPSALVTALNAHNHGRPGPEQIRLRMALHAGEINYDEYGVTAAAVNLAFRLVDAEPLKAALAGSPGVLAVIASSWFFDEVVRHTVADGAARYRPVAVSVKETMTTGWICLPDDPSFLGEPELDQLAGGSSWPAVFTPVPPSPYKGLSAFDLADRDLFFGRANVVQELVRAVATRALVPVVGASGVGKSSVVHAGLVPRLEEQDARWGFVMVRPRPTLMLALASGLARLSGSPVPVPPAHLEGWQERLSRLGLDGAAELAGAGSGCERVLVIADQFEEVLAQDSEVILQQLAELPDDGALRVVLTLREDSFGTFFVRHESFGERLRRSAVALRGMNRDELDEVVRIPAALRGVRITDALAEELAGAVLDRPGALPLLEFSLDQMWRSLGPGQQVLSFDAYEEIGRLDGALAAHADRVVDGLNDTEQGVVRNLFVNHLTSAARPDIRQVLRRSDCTPGEWQIIVQLAGQRLLTISRDDDDNQTAEVVHEALLRAWGRLRGWLDAERPFRSWRQFLRDGMKPWSETRDSNALLTGTLLATSERWLSERAADLNLDERHFIEMSLSRRAEEERRYQVLYRRSLARTLSHAAEAARDAEDNVLALLLAVEAAERSPDAHSDRLVRACLDRLEAAETAAIPREAVLAARARFRQRLTLAEWSRGPGSSQRWVLGNPEADLIVDQRGQVVYGTDGVLPTPGPVVAAAYTQAGVACLGTEGGELAVWQLRDRAEKVCSRDLGIPIACLAVNDAGKALAAACDDGVVRVLDGEDLSDVAHLPSPGFTMDIDISTDRLVAALSSNHQISVWDLVSRDPVGEWAAGKDAMRLAIDPGEDYVIVANAVASGNIRGFPLSARALIAWARQAAGRQLTDAERRHYIEDPPA
jgi:hypothetical protein